MAIRVEQTPFILEDQITYGSYDMLQWMLMSPSLRASNHFASTKLDGVTPSNHLFTALGTGKFYWIKGDSGYPWDINIFDNTYIYLSTTELTYASASEGKRFESLTSSIGYKGVPFAKRLMNIGDSVYSSDTRLALYTACGTATYTNLGTVKCTLTGPYVETIPGAGSTLPSNLQTIHLEYEWSLDASYHHQSGSTKETYTLCQPYGLVRWQTQNWNVGAGSYDAPNAATNYNILTAGTSGLPQSDPCPFGVNGGGSNTALTPTSPLQIQQTSLILESTLPTGHIRVKQGSLILEIPSVPSPLPSVTGGTFQDPLGNPYANGTITFQLSADAFDTNSQVMAAISSGYVINGKLDSNGNIIQPLTIWPNSLLTPSTYYTVKVYTATGQLVWNSPVTIPNTYPTVNFSSLIPQS